ncbi:MAG: DNA alkylation repair protein [Nitrospinae bacterium]|nr:DNA alkylation repair protein [Nitrospinota bacterium]
MVTKRKGARTMAEVSLALRRRLDGGQEEALTLVEWLVIDQVKLGRAVLPQVGFSADDIDGIVERYEAAAPDGVMSRLRIMAAAIGDALASAPPKKRRRLYEGIAAWPTADVVREWGALIVSRDTTMTPAARWEEMRRYAADESMNVREIAWMALRPWVAADVTVALDLYTPWVGDPHEGIRRCAVEGTRPRGVWTSHLAPLKADPSPALPLLEAVKGDPSRYVQNAVANWLNDASKDHPAWVQEVTARWAKESPTKETAYIVKRGLRTLTKK